MKKIIQNILIISFFYIFSYLVPKDKKIILFGSGFGEKFMGNPKYFYLWMIKNNKNDFKFYWITRNKKIYDNLRFKNFPVIFLYSFRGALLVLKAYLLIVEQSSKDIVGTAFILGKYKILNTLHGTPIKDLSIDEQVKEKGLIDLIFKVGIKMERKIYTMIACSDEIAGKLKKTFNNDAIYVTGYPRDDIFFDKTLSFVNYADLLNIKKYKKIFLYAPTLRDRGGLRAPFRRNFLVKLNEYLKKNNYLFMIRTHPLDKDKLNIGELSNFTDITHTVDDVQEILIYTDVLIADYSSLIFDYTLTKKTIIFYPFDYQSYIENSRNMYLDYYSELPGPFANNEKELWELIKTLDIWTKNKQYKERYKKLDDRFNKYQDGKSSERLYKLLDHLT